jgi:cytochrome c5
MAVFICETCESRFIQDSFPPTRKECFKCHVKGIRLGFKHGKEDFHGDTIKQRQEKILADAKKNGINAVPASEYGI